MESIKRFFECRLHNNAYMAYCSTCMINICDKCLGDNSIHIGHEIFIFKKIFLSEKQIKFYQTLYFLSKFYLNRVREIVVELSSDLIDIIIKTDKNSKNYPLLLNLKNKLKNTYKQFYKTNMYQMYYTKNILSLYFNCRNSRYIINYQIIKNIYNIKINSVKIPELEEKELFTKIQIMIDFMKNKNNNILRISDSEHPTTFYSYIDYNRNKTPKVNTYSIRLSSISFDISKGQIFSPNEPIQNDNDSIKEFSEETNYSENKDNYNDIEIITHKDKNDKNVNKINKVKEDKEYKEDIYSSNENVSNNNNKNNKIYIKKSHFIEEEEENNNNKYNVNINVKIQKYKDIHENENNQNISISNNEEEEKKENDIQYDNNSTNINIKNYIYSSLPKSCQDEVEFRNNIQYTYYDKIEKRDINSVYYGEFKKGTLKRHGRGLFLWEDGEYYLGYWANDKREGEGTNTYRNGNVYKGNYRNGKKDGIGTYEWKNGDKYEGNWKNDMKDGKGIYYYSNGDIYDGYFKKDKINGNGIYTWANKITYKGLFKKNTLDKKGYLTYSKSDIININQIKIKDNKSEDGKEYKDIYHSIDNKK